MADCARDVTKNSSLFLRFSYFSFRSEEGLGAIVRNKIR